LAAKSTLMCIITFALVVVYWGALTVVLLRKKK